MRRIEDLPTRYVFEEQGDEIRQCIPKGAMVHKEEAARVGLLAFIALITALLAKGSLGRLLQGNTTNGEIGFALINSLIFLACVLGIVIYLWRLRRKARNQIRRYIFDLAENTLSIEENGSPLWMVISPDKFPSFVVTFNPPCHGLILSGAFHYQIYGYSEPPPPEFISALTEIGLRKSDKLKTL
jgi:hypothetical protein